MVDHLSVNAVSVISYVGRGASKRGDDIRSYPLESRAKSVDMNHAGIGFVASLCSYNLFRRFSAHCEPWLPSQPLSFQAQVLLP